MEPLAEVGDRERPGATETRLWLVLVASTHANMRCPGGACALEKEEKDPLPGCLQGSLARDFGGVGGHWTEYQKATSGGELPKTQPASGLWYWGLIAVSCVY